MFGAGLLFWASIGSLLPTLPLYLRDLEVNPQQLGLVMGAFAIGLLGSRPWIGTTADRRSRKAVLLIGATISGLAPFCYLLVDSVPWLMVVRTFHGISLAAFTTGYIALVADIAPAESRGELLGYMSLINPIGVAIGPALGGLVQESFGNTSLFCVTGSLGLLCLTIISQVREQRSAEKNLQQESSPGEFSELWNLLTGPRVRILTLVLFHVGLAFGAMTSFVSLLIAETGVNFNGGWFFSAAAIASFAVRIVSGPLSDRIGRGLFVSLSLFLYSISMCLLVFANSAELFLLAGVLEGAGFGLMIPTISAIVADRAYPEERGRLLGLCLGGFDVGIALAGPFAGVIVASSSYQTVFIWATGFLWLGLFIFLTQSSKDLRHSLRYALGKGRDIYAL
ncbi:MFS transporter [Roseofilum casamattae]|uniref:MFS transporter n=1 Tax=Roseofilum casamattae BLCC-M143 TaxID=3022442 RepID=A0ABT7BX84_9CYAN|nr:MFS transporter [Roseofilum casamattae]MDJ1183781.1 MFS transporter [Roseofilum casamattae BLCC-M143]